MKNDYLSKTNRPAKLSLYHYQSCPFCVVTRKAIDYTGIEVSLRDIRQESRYRRELIAGGGKAQVPCLLIDKGDGEQQWLYESLEIINFLRSYKDEAIINRAVA